MRMKQLICLIFACTAGKLCMAQKSHVYLKGGLNIANISSTTDGKVDESNAIASFHVGIMGDLAIGKFFAIQPGLLLSGKGAKVQSGNPSDANYYKATTRPLYIELPVNAVVKIPLNNESNLFAGAGPYIAMGVGGKQKVEGKVLGVGFSSEESIKWSNDDPATFNEEEGTGFGVMKRFDTGINFTAGFQLDKVLLSANYGLGLAKLQSGSDNDNDRNKNRVFSISLGFAL